VDDQVVVRFALVDETSIVPVRKTEGASGYDLSIRLSARTEELRVVDYHPKLGAVVAVPLGVIAEIPKGYEGVIRSRSSTSAHVLVGTIDSDFRGELCALMWSYELAFTSDGIRYGFDRVPLLRVAQLVIHKSEDTRFVKVSREELSSTARGEKGYGSTNQ
jgi:deoxyuridine 5'-triphosphate nucleotidohydrolase